MSSTASFVETPRFLGCRVGCVFKLGPLGLGYYSDSPQPNPVFDKVREGAAAQLVAEKQNAHGHSIVSVVYNDDDDTLVSACKDGTLKVWRGGERRLLRTAHCVLQ